MNEAARLRLVQLGCVLLVLACIGLVHWRSAQPEIAMTWRHWLVIVGAVWTAVSGFTVQRRILRPRADSGGSRKSTPFKRWRAGHFLRLGTATAVGMWAVVLSDVAGPHWLVNVFFVIALLLLLLWSPGPAPDKV